MTARTPHSPGGGDVSETLGELERKLRQLETELASTGSRPSVTPAPEPETPAASAAIPAATSTIDEPAPTGASRAATGMGDPDRLIAEARARLGGLSGQVDELLRFRESLQRTARQLEDEYNRVLARIGAPAQTPAPAPVPAAATTALRGPIAPAEPPVRL
ncbi:MAG: hypothetical protein JWP17_1350, partial [Solirubrobacterales bacterium]|nr:hypothetical protein [Solirubrobacterales bacterium]